MSLIEKIPTLSDEALTNLLANARRLAESGADKQRAEAAELLPALEEAHTARRAAKAEAAAAKRAVALAARRKKAA
jgi:hypothetical protein